jgi:hypothetical protein
LGGTVANRKPAASRRTCAGDLHNRLLKEASKLDRLRREFPWINDDAMWRRSICVLACALWPCQAPATLKTVIQHSEAKLI